MIPIQLGLFFLISVFSYGQDTIQQLPLKFESFGDTPAEHPDGIRAISSLANEIMSSESNWLCDNPSKIIAQIAIDDKGNLTEMYISKKYGELWISKEMDSEELKGQKWIPAYKNAKPIYSVLTFTVNINCK